PMRDLDGHPDLLRTRLAQAQRPLGQLPQAFAAVAEPPLAQLPAGSVREPGPMFLRSPVHAEEPALVFFIHAISSLPPRAATMFRLSLYGRSWRRLPTGRSSQPPPGRSSPPGALTRWGPQAAPDGWL